MKCEQCGHEYGSVYCIAICPPAAPERNVCSTARGGRGRDNVGAVYLFSFGIVLGIAIGTWLSARNEEGGE